jgi:hypothetical protein
MLLLFLLCLCSWVSRNARENRALRGEVRRAQMGGWAMRSRAGDETSYLARPSVVHQRSGTYEDIIILTNSS